MVGHSVVAAVDGRDDDRDHLALDAAEVRAPPHQVCVEVVVGAHGFGVQAVDGDDIVHAAPGFGVLGVEFGQQAGGGGGGDYVDPGHA